MNIPYTYLAVLLVFTLLIGVVIGDRLAAGAGVVEGEGYGRDGYGHSGGCAGLASAHLHDCVHRQGYLRARTARSGAGTWPDPAAACELPPDARDGD